EDAFNLNELPDQYLARGNDQNNRVNNPFLGIFPATSTLGQGATITQRQLWLRYPQFTSLVMDSVNSGRTVYHSLQTKLDKRLSQGLSVLFSYSYSKLMSNLNSSASWINDRSFYRTISRYDQPSIVRVVLTYAPPAKFQRSSWSGKFANMALGGWTMAGYYTYETGKQ